MMLNDFSISLYIVSAIHFPLLDVNGCNFLCWHRFFLINQICHILWYCVRLCDVFLCILLNAFSISLYIVSDIHFPLLAGNGCNFLCWHRFFVINKICHILWCCVHFFDLFPYIIYSEQFFSPSPCNQNYSSSLVLPDIFFSMKIWSSSLIKEILVYI